MDTANIEPRHFLVLSCRYLLLEFPCLTMSQPPQHFLEIGCGCGSSLLPVLKANPTCSVTGSDLSPTAVHLFKQAAATAGIAADRVTAYAADSTHPPAQPHPVAVTGMHDLSMHIISI